MQILFLTPKKLLASVAGRCTSVVACVVLSMVASWSAAAEDVDIKAISKQLSHDDFLVRQRAERRLTAIGGTVIEESFTDVPPAPELPYGSDRSDYFNAITATAEAALKKGLYDHLPDGLDREARFRLERIRRALTEQIEGRVLKIRVKYPTQLPEDQAKLVEGYTGSFRDREEQWFDASYRNGSTFAVTAVRVRLRLSHKGKKVDHEIQLGPSPRPILPGESGTLSADAELPRGSIYEIHWQTVAIYGYSVPQRP